MCGIAGFWQAGRGEEHPLEILNRMGTVIAHRGPDDSGTFHDNATGIALAFRRLAIVDLSPHGHQPMSSISGRYVIVFNGEVYNYEEIRKELGSALWRGHSDTEVMLAAIEHWGLEAAVKRFVGMFAFALWDGQERTLHLVRDRLGIKPLYYGRADEDFVFASELKSICQHPKFSAEIDRDALALYMRHNYVPGPHCIYQGLYKLRPGCILTLHATAAEPTVTPFWSAMDAAKQGMQLPFRGSDAEATEELHQKLLESVRLRMIADVPLGAFLSGGIDSSTVVALMQAQSSRPVKTFTIGFDEVEYNEAVYAKKVATHLGTDHTELYLTGKDALDVVPLLQAMYDEPFSDSSQIPTYLVSKLARQRVTVSLSGDGGDELFGGYNRYLLTRAIWNMVGKVPLPLRNMGAILAHACSAGGIQKAFQLLQPLLPGVMRISNPQDRAQKIATYLRARNAEDVYLQACTHWEDPAQIVLQANEPDTFCRRFEEASEICGLEQAMMLTDMVTYLPDDILVKVDRASMAVSLEARVPLLDHRVVEFALHLPLHFKIRNGTSKWLLRQVLAKYIPAELVERPKMGFGIPMGAWLRGPLREWAGDLLSSKNLVERGLLNPKIIRQRWQEHMDGSKNWQYLLWDVLMFQDWLLKASQREVHAEGCQILSL